MTTNPKETPGTIKDKIYVLNRHYRQLGDLVHQLVSENKSREMAVHRLEQSFYYAVLGVQNPESQSIPLGEGRFDE